MEHSLRCVRCGTDVGCEEVLVVLYEEQVLRTEGGSKCDEHIRTITEPVRPRYSPACKYGEYRKQPLAPVLYSHSARCYSESPTGGHGRNNSVGPTRCAVAVETSIALLPPIVIQIRPGIAQTSTNAPSACCLIRLKMAPNWARAELRRNMTIHYEYSFPLTHDWALNQATDQDEAEGVWWSAASFSTR